MGGFPNAPLSSLTPDPSITSVPLQLLFLLPGVTVTQALITRESRHAPFSPSASGLADDLWIPALYLMPTMHI